MSALRTLAAGLALAGLAAPAIAQTGADDARFRAAQARFQREMGVFQQEFDRYQAARANGPGRYAPPPGGYRDAGPPPGGYEDDRYENGYDPARYYRAEGNGDRVLSSEDRVYAGSDGRYYCKRSDGTTGLIVGAAGGGVLGNVIDGGHSRAVGTLLGAAAGALIGKSVDQNNSQVRCR